MKKLFSLILMLLCIAGANAQQSKKDEAVARPEVVLVVGDKTLASGGEITLDEFCSSPCRLEVICADTTQLFQVTRFETIFGGLCWEHKGNMVLDEMKERSRTLKYKKRPYIMFTNIKAKRTDGLQLALDPFVIKIKKGKKK